MRDQDTSDLMKPNISFIVWFLWFCLYCHFYFALVSVFLKIINQKSIWHNLIFFLVVAVQTVILHVELMCSNTETNWTFKMLLWKIWTESLKYKTRKLTCLNFELNSWPKHCFHVVNIHTVQKSLTTTCWTDATY